MKKNKTNYCDRCGSPLERMLSIKSAATLLDCSEQFFRNLIRDRRISYKKIGGMVRIPYAELIKITDHRPSMQEMVDEALFPQP